MLLPRRELEKAKVFPLCEAIALYIAEGWIGISDCVIPIVVQSFKKVDNRTLSLVVEFMYRTRPRRRLGGGEIPSPC